MEFYIKVQTPPTHPPTLMKKFKKKVKNDLHAIKRILFDIGHPTVDRGLGSSSLLSDQVPS